MKIPFSMNLSTRALMITAAFLFLVLGVNTVVNVTLARNKYRELMISRAEMHADAILRDINKSLGSGLSLNAIEGMGERLRSVMEEDKNLSGLMIMDAEGRVLYAGDRRIEHSVPGDEPSRKALSANAPTDQFYSNDTGGHYEKILPLAAPTGKKIGVLRISLQAAAVSRLVRGQLVWSVTLGVVSILIAGTLAAFLMDRRIVRPLSEMSKAASRVAAGDLSREVPVEGQNEIADLGAAINAMSSSLRGTLQKISATSVGLGDTMSMLSGATARMSQGARDQQEATEQTVLTMSGMVTSNKGIAENAAEMSQAATDASSSAAEMASSIEEVARNIGTVSVAVEETASSIEEMIASIKQVSENTDALSVSAEQTSSSITEMSNSVKEVEHLAGESARLAERVSRDASERGMVTASEAINGMRNIKEAVEATAEVLNRLGNRSQEIGQILKVIDEVTDQTGLLALNAAILAAQAGAHGKGFAVVAEEIKDLAERTSASTQEISELIASVRKETAESVKAMNRGLRAVEMGVDLVNVTSDMLSQVADSSRQSAERARAIEKATAEQAKGVSQITENSMSIAEQIEKIAIALQEQRKGSERIALAAERMRDITRQVRNSTQEQTTGSRQIANAVESVTQQASQVARSTAEQNQGANQVNEAINRIQKITQDTVDVSIEMDMAAQMLKQKADELRAELDGFTS